MNNKFKDDIEKGKTLDQTPRNNFAINKLLHIAQSGGDFKIFLKGLADPTAYSRNKDGNIQPVANRPIWDNLLNGYFDKKTNNAFFIEDSAHAQELFKSLQDV